MTSDAALRRSSSRPLRRSPSSSGNVGTQFDAACVAALAEIVDLTVSLPESVGRSREDRDRRGLTPVST